jgi:hypothetical protein
VELLTIKGLREGPTFLSNSQASARFTDKGKIVFSGQNRVPVIRYNGTGADLCLCGTLNWVTGMSQEPVFDSALALQRWWRRQNLLEL